MRRTPRPASCGRARRSPWSSSSRVTSPSIEKHRGPRNALRWAAPQSAPLARRNPASRDLPSEKTFFVTDSRGLFLDPTEAVPLVYPISSYVYSISNNARSWQRCAASRRRFPANFWRHPLDAVAAGKRWLERRFRSALPAALETLTAMSVPTAVSRRRTSSRRGSLSPAVGRPNRPLAWEADSSPAVARVLLPVEPDASRGARPVRRRLARPKAAPTKSWARRQPGRSIRWRYPLNGGDRDTPSSGRQRWNEAGENPACGVSAEDARATQLAWGLPISVTRRTGLTESKARGPPDKRRPGRAQPREAPIRSACQ